MTVLGILLQRVKPGECAHVLFESSSSAYAYQNLICMDFDNRWDQAFTVSFASILQATELQTAFKAVKGLQGRVAHGHSAKPVNGTDEDVHLTLLQPIKPHTSIVNKAGHEVHQNQCADTI